MLLAHRNTAISCCAASSPLCPSDHAEVPRDAVVAFQGTVGITVNNLEDWTLSGMYVTCTCISMLTLPFQRMSET